MCLILLFQLSLVTALCTACAAAPNALHYPWAVEVEEFGYRWYKHDNHNFDLNACPPWSNARKSTGGLFPHPPRPSLLTSKASFAPLECQGPRTVCLEVLACFDRWYLGFAQRLDRLLWAPADQSEEVQLACC